MIDELIENALNENYIHSQAIEDFTIEKLIELSEKAKKNNLLITLSAEHSNLHQGILVNIVRKDIADKFIDWL
jgi:hypothetical protein